MIVGHAIIPIPYAIQNIEPIPFTNRSLKMFSIINEYRTITVPIYPKISQFILFK